MLTLEALGAGIPVVATAVSGRREYLSPATQGWLARAGNEHDVAQAIVEALAAPQARVAPSAGLPSIAEAGKAARAVLERVRANMGVRAAA